MSDEQRFRTTVQQHGRSATGFEVPEEVVRGLGPTQKPPVVVTLQVSPPYSYRSTVARMGGRFLLPLAAEHRDGAKLAAGDEVEIVLTPDTAPRVVEVPDDLRTALDASPAAAEAFAALSYSKQRQIVLAVEGAKAAETRARRVAKAVTDLGG